MKLQIVLSTETTSGLGSENGVKFKKVLHWSFYFWVVITSLYFIS